MVFRSWGCVLRENPWSPPPSSTILYDHIIDLKKSLVPKIAKVYPLDSKEQEACKAFIDKHLKTGQIVPSKSPQAAPFFFVAKKAGFLHPYQNYRYLNSHTIHNAYPLPLIPELIDDMKNSMFFTKFNVRWGFNNICIRKEDQWKGVHSSLLLAFLNQSLCSLGFAMGHLLFNSSWTTSLLIWSPNDGRKSTWTIWTFTLKET